MRLKLYSLETVGLGDFYCLAENASLAEESLIKILDESDYGFSSKRKVKTIRWLSDAFKESLSDKGLPFLSDQNARLLIVSEWS